MTVTHDIKQTDEINVSLNLGTRESVDNMTNDGLTLNGLFVSFSVQQSERSGRNRGVAISVSLNVMC